MLPTEINPRILEKIVGKLNTLSDEEYKETKTTFCLTKNYQGHEFQIRGPKIARHHWGVSRIKFPQRSRVNLVYTRFKINNSIICSVGSSAINYISSPDRNSLVGVPGCRVHLYQIIRITDVRPKGVLFLKLVFPEFFRSEMPEILF